MAGRTQKPEFPVGQFYDKGGRVVGFNIDNLTADELAQVAKATNQLLSEGRLQARIARVLPLSQAAEAHRLVDGTAATGKVAGRVVLTV
jgi:NADPH:quinone reductase